MSPELTSLTHTDFAISKDGTKIGYRQYGSGPGVILLHGGLQASQNFTKLAELISDAFTVYVPDRRGRGMSVPSDSFGLQKEVEDVDALLAKTGAHFVFGLSSGAVLSLQATLALPAIHKVALYEPPLPLKGQRSPAYWASGYEEALRRDDFATAMVTIVKGTGGTTIFTFLPGFIVRPLMNHFIKAQASRMQPGEVSMRSLIGAMRFDIQIVKDMEGVPLEHFKAMRADVLLLGGSKSPQYLKNAVDALEGVLPHPQRVDFQGGDHLTADNTGKPELVAQELRWFFKEN